MLCKIFFAALAIRWAYAIVMFLAMGDAGLEGIDSLDFVTNAHDLAARMSAGTLSGFQWLGIRGYAMPFFQLLIGFCALVFGAWTALGYVLVQGVFDAGTCVLIYYLAATLDRRFAAPAAIAAVLNPTMIVVSGLVYTDTPFLFFATLLLLATAQWLRRPAWPWALLIGVAIGVGTLSRPLAAPFAPVLIVFLLAAAGFRHILSLKIVAQVGAVAAILGLCIAPVLWRNVTEFHSWALTAQGGEHLARYVVPLVKEAQDGTPWQRTYDEINRRMAERHPQASDPFDRSRQYTELAKEDLMALGVTAIAKAWLLGAAINIASPAATLSPVVAALPRTRFYETTGATPIQKVQNFLFGSQGRLYAGILLAGIAGVVVIRVVQLAGLVVVMRQGGHWPALCLFGLWIGYVLAIDGPVASPKYRLPIEPPLMVFTGAALAALRRRGAQAPIRETGPTSPP